MKKITLHKSLILTEAVTLVAAVCCLAGCGSTAVQEVPQPAETSRAEEATPETAPAPTPTPAAVVPTGITLEQEIVKCSYCGGTGHTADTCAVKKTAEQQLPHAHCCGPMS